jgi:putative nucleotidyltransferase with HDIG domain
MQYSKSAIAEQLESQSSEDHIDYQNIRILYIQNDSDHSSVLLSFLMNNQYHVDLATDYYKVYRMLAMSEYDVAILDSNRKDTGIIAFIKEICAIAPNLPLIYLMSYNHPGKAREALHAGACDALVHPISLRVAPLLIETNLTRHMLTRKMQRKMEADLKRSSESLLDALLHALHMRDTETEGHSERVTTCALVLADLMGVSSREQRNIEQGALLHDIGKIGVPDRILLKPGPLNPPEWQEMKQHPIIGFQLCARMDFLKGASQIVLHHHERWNGKGYPDRLSGEAIPLGARIFSIADAFDAMLTNRPYARPKSCVRACEEIERCSGIQFDPAAVKAFRSLSPERWEALHNQANRTQP